MGSIFLQRNKKCQHRHPHALPQLVKTAFMQCAGLLYGKINWRVPKADGDFLQRGVVQTFRQQQDPAVLWNHGSEHLVMLSAAYCQLRTVSCVHALVQVVNFEASCSPAASLHVPTARTEAKRSKLVRS